MPKAISLFSGMGGDSLGIHNAGWNVVAFNEYWEPAKNTHQLNLGGRCIPGNIRDVPDSVFETYTNKIDLIFSGFPCQGFSNAGKKNPGDPRNELVYEFVRATRIIRPTYILGENVVGLLSRKGSCGTPIIDIIQRLFQDIGYTTQVYIVNASDVGVPQSRKRMFLLGSQGTLPILWIPKLPKVSIRSILLPTLENAIEVDWLPPGTKCIETTDVPTGTPHPWLVESIRKKLISFGKRESAHHVEIVDPDQPSKTIICTYERQPRLFVALSGNQKTYLRMFTPDELKQIQGFPADYVIDGSVKEQITQIGNAVPPPVVEMIVRQLNIA